jgi:ATP-dependent DNA helicase DinG
MDFERRVTEFFAPGGALSQSVAQYQPRAGQIEMAGAVARTIETGGVLVVEAGTGIGKTFAYLVPALMSGQRVMVSTATKALQDQLFGQDLPRLAAVLNLPLKMALLKGRSSYLCLERLARNASERAFDGAAVAQLARVQVWAQATQTGDLAEVAGLEEAPHWLPSITSTRDNCLGARCSEAERCFVNRARREALAADLVVVNHHLFFADLQVRESGVAELLPSVACVVFDEAHQLNEIGVQFLGKQLGSAQLDSLVADVLQLTQAQARGWADWQGLAQAVRATADGLRRHGARYRTGRVPWDTFVSNAQGLVWLQACAQALHALGQSLDGVAQASADLQSMRIRCQSLEDAVAGLGQPCPPGAARWVEVGAQLRWVEAPLTIAAAMQGCVADAAAQRRSWVFTSATLGHDQDLSWFVDGCGLQGAQVLCLQSPFDYARQARLYLPTDLPQPADPAHSAAVAALAFSGALVLGGRTMVLTTSLRAMRAIGEALTLLCAQHGDLELMVQGQMPKRLLLERFAQGSARTSLDAQRGCILVASVSFWEGIDLPGQALQLLVIDKLPFSPPDDPMHQARGAALQEAGKSAFKHLHLPQAAVALKQGAGRLIRRESDQGVLVVCDVRLSQRSYAKPLLAALPPMARLSGHAAFIAHLEAITKPSTTDRCSDGPPA